MMQGWRPSRKYQGTDMVEIRLLRWKFHESRLVQGLFLLFLVDFIFLSYVPLPFSVKIPCGALFFLFPFLWALTALPWKHPDTSEIFFFKPWMFAAFVLLLLWSRFTHLTTVPFWPIMDEGRKPFFAMELLKKWDWTLLWGGSQIEPLYIWLLAFFFKLVPPSLTAIRLFPALVSLATVAVGCWTARQFFGRFFSFLFCAWLAFTFWPFTFSRLCMRVGFFLFFELAALGCLGLFLKSRAKALLAVLLGLVTGLGFYTYTSWPVVALFFLSVLALRKSDNYREKAVTLFLFLVPLVLAAAPWAWARCHAGGLNYVSSLFHPAGFLKAFLDYGVCLFWYGFGTVPFGPNWGGLLNPVLGSLVFLGILNLKARWPVLLWAAWAFFLALLPGALTGVVEPHRVTAALPLVALLGTGGLEFLLAQVQCRNRLFLFLIFFVLSFGLDLYQFTGPYLDQTAATPDKNWRSVERYRAFQILQKAAQVNGPIAVLDEFSPLYGDQTLKMAVYPFDPVLNPKLKLEDCHWMAVLTDSNYEPFLKARFPMGQWTWLAPDLLTRNGGLMLGLIPIDSQTQALFQHWGEANQAFGNIASMLIRRGPGQPLDPIEESLVKIQPQCEGDPFLESVYWEEKAFLASLDSNLPGIVEGCRKAIALGYPAANLYNDLGIFLALEGKKNEAYRNFVKALHCPVNRTAALEHLKELESSSSISTPGL